MSQEVIHAFCGSRAKSTRGDWIIEASAKNRNMIHVAGIDSPGLAGSPSIALEVVRLLQDAGVTLAKNPTFNPNRAPIIVPKAGWKGLKAGPPGTVTDPQMAVICKCEKVTEAEVVTALVRCREGERGATLLTMRRSAPLAAARLDAGYPQAHARRHG